MSIWFIVLTSLLISVPFKLLFPTKKPTHSLPPGPPTFPIIGNFLWLRKSFFDLEPILHSLHAKFGPIVTLHIGSNPAIFVADRSLTHQALVQNSAIFADRPPALATAKIDSSNQHNINTAFYGPTWRLLRRNLTSEILSPSGIKSFSPARKWVLQILVERLKSESKARGTAVQVVDHFSYAIFCLLVFMCFGDKLDENVIERIEEAQHRLQLNLDRFNTLNFWPRVTKFVFSERWKEFMEIRQNQEKVLIPLIRERKKVNERYLERIRKGSMSYISYVDTLFDLQLPDENRKLHEGEIVSLRSEFLDAGTDSISIELQWIMANMI